MGGGSTEYCARCHRCRASYSHAVEDGPQHSQEIASDAHVWYDCPAQTQFVVLLLTLPCEQESDSSSPLSVSCGSDCWSGLATQRTLHVSPLPSTTFAAVLTTFADDYKQAGFWTIVELHTAIVCACMPGIRNLLRRAWPKLMGQTVASTGASTAPSTGLSGRTAVSSGVDKSGTQVFTRPRHSDDGDFIPLEERHSQRELKAVSPA